MGKFAVLILCFLNDSKRKIYFFYSSGRFGQIYYFIFLTSKDRVVFVGRKKFCF